MAYHFYFLKLLSHVVNFENFQPTFLFSCWEWDFTGECVGVCVRMSLCFDFCGLHFMYLSQSKNWKNLWNLSTTQQTVI